MIAVIVVILILYYFHMREPYVSSNIDNRQYRVVKKYQDQQEAADRLALINQLNLELIDYMVSKYRDSDGSMGHVLASRLAKRYKSDRLVENNPVSKDATSYTENKGEVLALCLREKVTGKNRLHDQNMIEFVNLHELAHIASEGWGHEEEFWTNFRFLLNEAYEAGLHQPLDYSKWPKNYCGLDVSFSPFYQ